MRGKKLRSIVKVGFHERRLQFMEKELINQWRNQRQTDRILEIDIPLSYGINEIINDPVDINKCYFSWEPTKETGIYIKVIQLLPIFVIQTSCRINLGELYKHRIYPKKAWW